MPGNVWVGRTQQPHERLRGFNDLVGQVRRTALHGEDEPTTGVHGRVGGPIVIIHWANSAPSAQADLRPQSCYPLPGLAFAASRPCAWQRFVGSQ